MKRRRNVVVLGYSKTGKTALCTRFANNTFLDSYEPTYENTYQFALNYGREAIDMRLTDTQGQEEQDNFRPEYCLGAHGFVLVYSVDSMRSLEACVELNQRLVNLLGDTSIPRILVGNKTDASAQRCISTSMGARVARQTGCKFIECSAKENSNVQDVIDVLLDDIDSLMNDSEGRKSILYKIAFGIFDCRPGSSVDRLQVLTKILIILSILFSLVSIIFSLMITVNLGDNPDYDITGFFLYSYSLYILCFSCVGLIGVYRQNLNYLISYLCCTSIALCIFTVFVLSMYMHLQPFQEYYNRTVVCIISNAVAVFVSLVLCYAHYGSIKMDSQAMAVSAQSLITPLLHASPI